MKARMIMFAALMSTLLVGTADAARPLPQGNATVNMSYPLAGGGTYNVSEERNFLGTNPSHATELGDNSNMSEFNSVNAFGRRMNVAAFYPQVLGPDESLISHSFFKLDNSGDLFPGISDNGMVTVSVQGIRFNEPVQIDNSTVLFHNLWDTSQFDTAILRGLFSTDTHGHYFHTLTDPFRDAAQFQQVPGEFSPPNQMSHQNLGDMAPYITITGEGTDTLGFTASFPYDLLRHPHEHNDGGHHGNPYEGLPAPQGFLEPFHFHFEYVVSAIPEPTTLALLSFGVLGVLRRRN